MIRRYFKQSYFTALSTLQSRLSALPTLSSTPLTEIALRWMQHHSLLQPQDGVIIGASSAQQCEQNCVASEGGPLPKEAVEAIDEAWETVKAESVPVPLYWGREGAEGGRSDALRTGDEAPACSTTMCHREEKVKESLQCMASSASTVRACVRACERA